MPPSAAPTAAPTDPPSPGVHLVHLRAAEPPYDDPPYDGAPRRLPSPAQAALAFPQRSRGARLALVPTEPPPDLATAPHPAPDVFAPRRTGRAALPPPGPLAARLAHVVLEVLAAERPVQQLAGVAAPALLADLERAAGRRPRRPAPRAVRSVHVREPSDGVAEVCAVVQRAGVPGERYGALAFRLEGVDGRWRLTSLQVG